MKINRSSRLLVVSPHPDDEALGVGGLIGKALKEGAKTLIYYVCVGNSRQLVTGKTESSTRLKEIAAVKKLTRCPIQIGYIGQEFCRLDAVPQKDITEKVEDVIEQFKPSIVAVPCHTSYNQDHRAVYTACITALRPVPKSLRHYVDTVIEFFEPYNWGVETPPTTNCYLNLAEKYKTGDLLDFKIALYKCHKTQVRQDPFARSPENLRHWAHIVGREAGVSIAEGYNLLRETVC